MSTLYIFPHTHWDREWYQPFETFRVQLVQVTRKVIADLEAGKLSCFYLDGQSVVLEDVLELAPELAERISTLMKDGRLAAGPWYVLPDQMLVCGESLVRNLRLGLKIAGKFGPPSMTGYSPDTFGHSQDLPRVLVGFGIDSAFVWRGVPQLAFGPAFWWRSPDGSQVLAYHFAQGYYQTLFHEVAACETDDAARKVHERVLAMLEDQDGLPPPLYDKLIDGALLPAGADHIGPPANLAAVAEKLNSSNNGLKVKLVQPVQFAEMLAAKLKEHKGNLVGLLKKELRDNGAAKTYANAFLLPGVLSARLYLKRENMRTEYRLARFGEPLFLMLAVQGKMVYPTAELNHAWRMLLRNHPHDSICGTSVDAVHEEMMVRYARVHHVLDALTAQAEQALNPAGDLAPHDPERKPAALAVINPCGRTFTGPVRFRWYEMPGQKRISKNLAQVSSRKASEELFAGFGRIPYYKNVDVCDGWLWVDAVPPFGEVRIPADGSAELPPAACKAHGHMLENGLLHLTVNDRGDLTVTELLSSGALRSFDLKHRLRDTGDGGDTYNYDPLENDKPIIAKLISTKAKEKGPMVASLVLTWEMKIPEGLSESAQTGRVEKFKRTIKTISHKFETEITLKRGSKVVWFETRWQNQSVGHRLEVVFETGNPVQTTFSENHFSLAQRLHHANALPKSRSKVTLPVAAGEEAPPDRFPCQRFFLANGQLFLNCGLPEYGVEGSTVSLTILRSVDILSRGPLRTRGGGAGPHITTRGAACFGPQIAQYGWAPLPIAAKPADTPPHIADETTIAAYELADEFEAQTFVVPVDKAELAPVSLMSSSNPAVRIISTYLADDHESIFVRLLNVSMAPHATKLSFDFDIRAVQGTSLSEEEEENEFFIYRNFPDDEDSTNHNSSVELSFKANELKTIKLRLKHDVLEEPAKKQIARKPRTKNKRSEAG